MLHVVHWPFSGIGTLIRGVIQHLRGEVESHIVFLRRDESALDEFRKVCTSVHCIDARDLRLTAFLRMRRLWNLLKPDIIHTHSYQPLVWACLLLPGTAKHVTTVHSDYPYLKGGGGRAWLKRETEALLLQRFPVQVVAVGRHVLQLVAGLGVPDDRLALIENGIDFDRWLVRNRIAEAERQRLGFDKHDFIFVSVGRLDIRQKGLDLLMEALSIAHRSCPLIKVLLVGDGPDRARVLALAERLGVDGAIRVTGYVGDPRGFMYAADAYVSSSRFEGFGLALAEAVACGLPAIATRAGVADCIIDNRRTGILVDVEDVTSIANALITMATTTSASLAKMGHEGHKRVADLFDLRTTTGSYLSLYRAMMAQPGGGVERARDR